MSTSILKRGVLLGFIFLGIGALFGILTAINSTLNNQTNILGKKTAMAKNCTTIQDGTLLRTDGIPVVLGFDEWGYNYQGRFFKGGYCDAYRDAAWCQDYKDVDLMMKWNAAWLDNKDCDDDGQLDRHYGYDSYIGSGAWLTNHMKEVYTSEEGNKCQYEYFVKIVAAPADANLVDNVWYEASGTEIGPAIWGDFAIIQQVENDPCAGLHGVNYLSPTGPGFGQF